MIYGKSDKALLEMMGEFVRQARILKSYTQQELANKAGLNRSTISQLEKGEGITLLNFIQVLRVLQRLDALEVFDLQPVVSPLKVAESDAYSRRRVRKSPPSNSTKKSEW